MAGHALAQLNVARLKAPLDSPFTFKQAFAAQAVDSKTEPQAFDDQCPAY